MIMMMPKDVRQIVEMLKQFAADARLLDDLMPSLIEQYPNKWAGIFLGERYIADTRKALIAQFNEPGRVPMKCLSPIRKKFILASNRGKVPDWIASV